MWAGVPEFMFVIVFKETWEALAGMSRNDLHILSSGLEHVTMLAHTPVLSTMEELD